MDLGSRSLDGGGPAVESHGLGGCELSRFHYSLLGCWLR